MWTKLAEPVAELRLQRLHVRDPALVGLAGDDRHDLPLLGPVRLGKRANREAQLLERLGVGRDQGEVGVLVRGRHSEGVAIDAVQLGKLAAQRATLHGARAAGRRGDDPEGGVRGAGRGSEPRPELATARGAVTEPRHGGGPIGRQHLPDAAEGDDDRPREPDGAAHPVEVEAQDEVGDQPWIAEAQPDRADDDRPADEAGHHLEQPAEPARSLRVASFRHQLLNPTPPVVGRGRRAPISRPGSASHDTRRGVRAPRRSMCSTGRG